MAKPLPEKLAIDIDGIIKMFFAALGKNSLSIDNQFCTDFLAEVHKACEGNISGAEKYLLSTLFSKEKRNEIFETSWEKPTFILKIKKDECNFCDLSSLSAFIFLMRHSIGDLDIDSPFSEDFSRPIDALANGGFMCQGNVLQISESLSTNLIVNFDYPHANIDLSATSNHKPFRFKGYEGEECKVTNITIRSPKVTSITMKNPTGNDLEAISLETSGLQKIEFQGQKVDPKCIIVSDQIRPNISGLPLPKEALSTEDVTSNDSPPKETQSLESKPLEPVHRKSWKL